MIKRFDSQEDALGHVKRSRLHHTLLIFAATFFTFNVEAALLSTDWTAATSTPTSSATGRLGAAGAKGTATVTLSTGAYSNAGGVFPGTWNQILPTSLGTLYPDSGVAIGYPCNNTPQAQTVTFSIPVNEPYLLFNYVDAGTVYNFGANSGSIELVGNTVKATIDSRTKAVTLPTTGTSFNGSGNGFVVKLSGAYSSISFTTQIQCGGTGDSAGFAVAENGVSVTPTAGPGGSISPNQTVVLLPNTGTTFTVSPNTGYQAQVGGSCKGTLSGTTYTLEPVGSDCSVRADFVDISTHIVTVRPKPGSSIRGEPIVLPNPAYEDTGFVSGDTWVTPPTCQARVSENGALLTPDAEDGVDYVVQCSGGVLPTGGTKYSANYLTATYKILPPKVTRVSCTAGSGTDPSSIDVSLKGANSKYTYLAIGSPNNASGKPPGCSFSPSVNVCQVPNLSPKTSYVFSVQVNDPSKGAGAKPVAFLNCRNAQPSAPPPPQAPTNVLGQPGDGLVVLNWTPPPGDVSTYKICATTPSDVTCVPLNGTCSNPGAVSSCVATSLTRGTPYYFTVTAINGGGSGPASSPAGPITPEALPGVPQNLTAIPGDKTASLTWNPPTNTGTSPITNYVVEYSSSPAGGWAGSPLGTCGYPVPLVQPGPAQSCFNNQLSNDQPYYFRVAAENSVGVGPFAQPIQVTPTAPKPSTQEDTYNLTQGTILKSSNTSLLSVFSNDTLIQSGKLRDQPTRGVLDFNESTGEFSYTPDKSFVGTDTFTYIGINIGINGAYTSKPTKVTLTVTKDTTLPPVANPTTYTVPANNILNILAPGVLFNDTDPGNNPLQVRSSYLGTATTKQGGTVYLNADGSFQYKPAQGFLGTDIFTYSAFNGKTESKEALISIIVKQSDQPPQANPITFSMAQDTTLTVPNPGVTANDVDPDKDAIYASLSSGPSHGTLTLSVGGGFVYRPITGFNGVDTFTYVASDGELPSVPATVTINVNSFASNLPPVGQPDQFTLNQDGILILDRASGVLKNDFDPEGHPLSRIITKYPSNGNFAPVDRGGFTYEPNPGFTGVDTLTYEVSDGQLSSGPIEVRLVVIPTIKKPQANPDSWSVTQNTKLNVLPSEGVLKNDLDPQGAMLSAMLESYPKNGTLTPIDGGGFYYISNSGYIGTDTFTYHNSNGSIDSDSTTVSITVTALPLKKPQAKTDRWSVRSGDILSILPSGVLANDIGPQGVALTAVPTSQPQHGTLSMDATGGFRYTPNAGFSGEDYFYYTANAGGLASASVPVTITVSPKAPPPDAPASGIISIPGGTGLVYTPPSSPAPVGAKPTKPKPAPGQPVVVVPPSNGSISPTPTGGFSYQPNPGFTGTDPVSLVNTTGTSSSGNGNISIRVTDPETNRPPIDRPHTYRSLTDNGVIESAGKGLLKFAKDPEGHYLRAVIVEYPEHGQLTLQPDGEFTYSPEPGFIGIDTFQWKSTDGLVDGNVVTDKLICTRCSRRE